MVIFFISLYFYLEFVFRYLSIGWQLLNIEWAKFDMNLCADSRLSKIEFGAFSQNRTRCFTGAKSQSLFLNGL